MLKAIAFGLAAGAAVQAWRNFPADGPASTDSVAVITVLGLLAAYLAGRWHGRHYSSATATATAVAVSESHSQATNTVQLAIVVPGQGARAHGISLPSDEAPWLAGVQDRPAITADQLDGLEFSELFPDHDSEPQASG